MFTWPNIFLTQNSNDIGNIVLYILETRRWFVQIEPRYIFDIKLKVVGNSFPMLWPTIVRALKAGHGNCFYYANVIGKSSYIIFWESHRKFSEFSYKSRIFLRRQGLSAKLTLTNKNLAVSKLWCCQVYHQLNCHNMMLCMERTLEVLCNRLELRFLTSFQLFQKRNVTVHWWRLQSTSKVTTSWDKQLYFSFESVIYQDD